MMYESRPRQRRTQGFHSFSIFFFLLITIGVLVWQYSENSEPPPGSADEQISIGYIEALRRQGEGALPELIHWLESGTDSERRDAAVILSHLGREVRSARSSLVRSLEDPSPQVREASLTALVNMYEDDDAASHTDPAARLLGDEDGTVREAAANLLRRIGPTANWHLCAMLFHQAEPTRILAARTLLEVTAMGGGTMDILSLIARDIADGLEPVLPSPLPDPQLEALYRVETQWVTGPGGPSTDFRRLAGVLATYIEHEDPKVRSGAAMCLRNLGPGVLPFVIRHFDSPNERTMRIAMHVVSEIGVFDESLVERCRRICAESESPALRYDALALIIASGAARPEEIRTALHPDSPLCQGMLEMFARRPDRSHPWIAETLELLSHDPNRFVYSVVRAIEPYTPPDSQAIPVLRGLLHSPVPYVRLAAARALHRISVDQGDVVGVIADIVVAGEGGQMALADLLELAPDAVPGVVARLRTQLCEGPLERRQKSFVALAALGKASAPALPEILECLAGNDPALQPFATLAVAGIGPEASAAVPRLIELLEVAPDESPEAAKLHISMGTLLDAHFEERLVPCRPPSIICVPRLVELFMQIPATELTSILVLAALERMGQSASAALPSVVSRLDKLEAMPVLTPHGHRHHWRKCRCLLLQTMAGIAPDDVEVTTRLRGLLGDKYPEAQLWAATLLIKRAGPDADCVASIARVLNSFQSSPGITTLCRPYHLLSDLAVMQLSRPECRGREAVDALLTAAKSGPASRDMVFLALQRISMEGPAKPKDFEWSAADIAILASGLEHYDIKVRRSSVELLKRMRPLSQSVTADLERAARDWRNVLPGPGEQVSLSYSTSGGPLGIIARIPDQPALRKAVLELLAELSSGS